MTLRLRWRRTAAASLLLVAPSAAGCSNAPPDGLLRARPHQPTLAAPATGLSSIGLGGGRDGRIFVPSGYRPDQPAALIVLLHGAGQSATYLTDRFTALAEEFNAVLLAPDSRGGTWDLIQGQFGADVAFLDRALGWTFDRLAIDPARIAVAGFSDGATYALSLGITNGDFFRRLVAFSPGFYAFTTVRGKPPIFVSHGTQDQILPIDNASRRIVPELIGAGYLVQYREFDGPHTIPPAIAREAMVWLGLGPAAQRNR